MRRVPVTANPKPIYLDETVRQRMPYIPIQSTSGPKRCRRSKSLTYFSSSIILKVDRSRRPRYYPQIARTKDKRKTTKLSIPLKIACAKE